MDKTIGASQSTTFRSNENLYHNNEVGGAHFGFEKEVAALKQKFHWPKMHQDIND